jgi:transposase-like protein
MPKYTQPGMTWQYSNGLRVKSAQLSLTEGSQVQEVANTLGINPFMLSRWCK